MPSVLASRISLSANHATNLLAGESAAIENRFAFLTVRALCTGLNGTSRERNKPRSSVNPGERKKWPNEISSPFWSTS
jgi:hypothetical protein